MMRYITWLFASLTLLWNADLAAAWEDTEPASVYQNHWIIEPLMLEDADAFYEAYQGSQRLLYNTLGWGWPTAKISREMNIDSVAFHVQQHQARKAYSYVVREPQHHNIVGAVYITPVQHRRGVADFDPSRYDAEVAFWLTQEGQEHPKNAAFVDGMLSWLTDEWQFQRTLLPVFRQNDFARNHYEALNLEFVAEDRDNKELLYSFRAR